jgi:endopolyphosphatase
LGIFMGICEWHLGSPDQRHILIRPPSSRNIDHFFFLDVDELESTTGLKAKAETRNDRAHALGRTADTALQLEIHKDFSEMPKLKKIKWEDYAVVHVSPSVIPTYLPGLRVFR